MIYYKIGCNFDPKLIDGILELNYGNTNRIINELFGSDREHAYLTARPAFRLPDIDKSGFEKYLRRCIEAGVKFNYTMNSPYPGSKKFLSDQKKKIIDHVKFLEDSGVAIITISAPVLAEFIREASSSIEIEISTIAHIDTVTQIKAWKDKYSINRICSNLLKNRSVKFLRNAATYCKANNIVLNLMVNEFCSTGGGDDSKPYSTHCIYRDSCYLCHAENETPDDDRLLNRYPMAYCISSRSHSSTWLKSMFIRPEDIYLYENIGIDHFKITGRTATTQYLLKVAEAYIRGIWNDNLLALWKPLETIHTHQNELDFEHNILIDNSKLNGFVNFWFENENHDCSIEICGETCRYCNEYAKRVML